MSGMIGWVGTPARELEASWRHLASESSAWGLAGYHAERAVYFGRCLSMAETPDAMAAAWRLAERSGSDVMMGYGLPSGGEVTVIQPYLWREWMLALDGGPADASAFVLRDSVPQGPSASERLFLWLMESVRYAEDPIQAMGYQMEKAREKGDVRALRFLMTNGKTLWAYNESEHALGFAPSAESGWKAGTPGERLGSLRRLLGPRELVTLNAGQAPVVTPL